MQLCIANDYTQRERVSALKCDFVVFWERTSAYKLLPCIFEVTHLHSHTKIYIHTYIYKKRSPIDHPTDHTGLNPQFNYYKKLWNKKMQPQRVSTTRIIHWVWGPSSTVIAVCDLCNQQVRLLINLRSNEMCER